MHILILPTGYTTSFNPIRGQFFRQQAIALKNAGHQVGVIAPAFRSLRLAQRSLTGWPTGVEVQDDDGIPTYRYHSWAWLSPFRRGHHELWLRAGRLLYQRYVADRGKPDLVHAHAAYHAGILACRLEKDHGVPYVLTEHSTAYARDMYRPWQISRLEETYANAAARLVVSPELGKLVESVLGDAGHPWTWVPNVVDSRFQPAADQNLYPEGSQPFRFLNIALMTEKKGQADLLQAFASRFKGNDQVQLRIGGDGPLRSNLERLASDLAIASQVVFLGMLSHEQVLAEMQAAAAFVLSSHYETFGVVLIEAMACGKPVVATACGGPESIVHSGNGLLVPPRDPAALGEALAQMRSDRTAYNAESIRSECLSRFGEEALVSQLEQIYASALQDSA